MTNKKQEIMITNNGIDTISNQEPAMATIELKTIDRNTLKVESTTKYTADDKKFIHMKMNVKYGNYISVISFKLKMEASNKSICNARLSSSSASYLIGISYGIIDYLEEDGKIYRIIDVTNIIDTKPNQDNYFAITTENGGILDISEASLIIEYNDNYDFYENQKYLTNNIGNKDSYQVNVGNGKFKYQSNLIGDLRLVYNASKDVASIPVALYMPTSFKLNIQQVIYQQRDSYIYIDAEYRQHVFKQGEESLKYYEEDGNYLTMEITSSGYEIADEGHNKYRFDSSGRLIEIEKDGLINTTITYTNGLLSEVVDCYGHKVHFTFSNNNKTISITCDAINNIDKTIELTIDSNNLLVSKKEIGQTTKITKYEYEARSLFSTYSVIQKYNYYLSKITTPYNLLEVEYDKVLRTTKITNELKNNYQITYQGQEREVSIEIKGRIRTFGYHYGYDGSCEYTYEKIDKKIGNIEYYKKIANKTVEVANANRDFNLSATNTEKLLLPGTTTIFLEPYNDTVVYTLEMLTNLNHYNSMNLSETQNVEIKIYNITDEKNDLIMTYQYELEFGDQLNFIQI